MIYVKLWNVIQLWSSVGPLEANHYPDDAGTGWPKLRLPCKLPIGLCGQLALQTGVCGLQFFNLTSWHAWIHQLESKVITALNAAIGWFSFFGQHRKQHVQMLVCAGCAPSPVCLTEAEPSIHTAFRTWGHQHLALQYFSCQYDIVVINKFTDLVLFLQSRLGVLRRESWPGHLWATCSADSNEMWGAGLFLQVHHVIF